MNKLIINTSSSLFFAKIGLFPKLLKKFKIITSKEISEEIVDGTQFGDKDASIIKQYLEEEKVDIIDAKKTKEISKQFNIKWADASVIALAGEHNGFLATEDRQIEKICLLSEIKVINTATLVYYLWKNNEVEFEQSLLLLELLLRQGYNKEIYLKIKEKIIMEE